MTIRKTFSILGILSGIAAYGQTEASTVEYSDVEPVEISRVESAGNNDIVISPLVLLASTVNFSYERLLNKDSGIGIDIAFSFGDKTIREDSSGYSHFLPYYRYYFGKKYASGFYMSGIVGLVQYKVDQMSYSSNNNSDIYYTSSKPRTNSTGTAGFGFGGKWIVKKNIVLEAGFSVTRNFNTDYAPFNGTGMLGIGKRF